MRWPISRVDTTNYSQLLKTFSLPWPQDATLPYPLLSHWLLFLSHLGQIFIFFIFWPLDVRVLQVSILRPVLFSTHVPRFFMLLTHRFLSQVWITLLKFRFPCFIAYSTFPLRCLTGIRNLWYPHTNTWAPPDTCSFYSIPCINKWNLLHSAVQTTMQNFLWCLFLSHPTIESIISVWFILNMYLDSIYSHYVVQVTITPLLAYLPGLYTSTLVLPSS